MVKFCGLCFKGLTKEIILEEEKKMKFIITCNSEFIVKAQKNIKFANIINENYATFDGQIPYILAKLFNKNRKIEKISGSEIIYDFCQLAKKNNKRVFLLGGYSDSNKKSIEILKEKYQIEISGYSPPFESYPFSEENNTKILQKIASFRPHILFVGFGAVKQEFWIYDHKDFLEDIGVKFVIGVGGAFEMISRKKKRAPIILQKTGLEGLWRFLIEPKFFRLKRLLISLLIFKYVIKKQ